MKGMLIVLEGPDGSGTTHHTDILCKKLAEEGYDAMKTAEPTEGFIGRFVRRALREHPPAEADSLQLLFCADRAHHLSHLVLPAMKKGKIVVCDRYVPSTLAYGEALGLDPAWLKALNKNFLKPDLTILLLPDLKVSLSRVARRSETDVLETDALQKKVHAAYKKLAKGSTMKIVDSSGSKQETARAIWEIVKTQL
jgi:dTMP kinase